MMQRVRILRFVYAASFVLLIVASDVPAGYKFRPWNPRSADTYAAKLTSEHVTIAVEPLFRDDLAAQVFDKNDMVTRGIMPLAIVIFNDNEFAVRIEANAIELITGNEHVHTLQPGEVAARIFQKSGRSVWIPQPVPRAPGGERLNPDALSDLDHKFLGSKVVPAHEKSGGFLYVHPLTANDLRSYISKSVVYIPDVYREDNGTKMIFFEIDLKPATDIPPSK